MPLYEWECSCGHKESVWASIVDRESRPEHECDGQIRRLPGGYGLLHFEESRARVHLSLSDRPITSKAQHEKLMKAAGVTEAGNYIPKQIRDNPLNPKMREIVGRDAKGRWL